MENIFFDMVSVFKIRSSILNYIGGARRGDDKWLKFISQSYCRHCCIAAAVFFLVIVTFELALEYSYLIHYILLETLSDAATVTVSASYHYRREHSANFRFHSIARHFDPFKMSVPLYIYLLNVKCAQPRLYAPSLSATRFLLLLFMCPRSQFYRLDVFIYISQLVIIILLVLTKYYWLILLSLLLPLANLT